MRLSFILTSLAGVALLVFCISCAKAPDTELTDAKTAIESAEAAQAKKYAPEQLTVAQDSLNSAIVQIEKQKSVFALVRSYECARKTLASAEMIAESAATEAAELKEEIEYEEANKVAIFGQCEGFSNGELRLWGKALDYRLTGRTLPGTTPLYTNLVIDDYKRAPNESEPTIGWPSTTTKVNMIVTCI